MAQRVGKQLTKVIFYKHLAIGTVFAQHHLPVDCYLAIIQIRLMEYLLSQNNELASQEPLLALSPLDLAAGCPGQRAALNQHDSMYIYFVAFSDGTTHVLDHSV